METPHRKDPDRSTLGSNPGPFYCEAAVLTTAPPCCPDTRNQMDFLDLLTDEEVTRVFHCKKTEMSCMEEPHTFLNQLRDYDLIPENLYKKVKKERCNEKKDGGVYQILDWLEKKRGNDIKLFWRCVFQEHILKKYSVLRSLRESFLNDAERKSSEKTQMESKPMKNQSSLMLCEPMSDVQAECDDGEKTSNTTLKEKINENAERKSREKTQTEIKPMKNQSEKSTEESKEEAGSSMLCETMSDVQAEWDDGEKTLNATLKEKINESSMSIFNNIQDAEMTSGKEMQTENIMEAIEEQRNISFEEEAGFSMLCELFSDEQAECGDVEKTSNTTTKEKRNESNVKMNEEAERKCREKTDTENTPTKEQRKKSIEESKEEADAEMPSGKKMQIKNTPMKEQREKSTEKSKNGAGSSMLCEPIPDVQAACDKKKTLNATAKEKRNESNEEMNKEADSFSIYNYIQDAEMTSGKKMQSESTPMEEEEREKSIEESEEEADAEMLSGIGTQSDNSMNGERENFTEEITEEAGSPMSCELLLDVEAECEDVERTPTAIPKEKTNKSSSSLCEPFSDVQEQCDYGKRTSKATTKEKRKENNEETSKRTGSPSQSTPIPNKKLKKSNLSTEQSENINTEDLSDNLLPVTCGGKTGVLHKDRLIEGNECIQSEGRWFTATGFENFGGKGAKKNWKYSIYSGNTPLGVLIKEGKLKYIQRRSMKIQKQSPKSTAGNTSPESTSGEEREKSEDEEGGCVDKQLFKGFSLPVSCGSVFGSLYKERFTRPHSKSIRTEERWFSAKEFINQDLTLTCKDWKKDILCHGKNFRYLLKNQILSLHSHKCKCEVCRPETPNEQNNDDFCFICDDGGDLVCCDDCPRSFHERCHIPALNDKLRDHWTCTSCVVKTNKKSHMTEEEALNQPISDSIMHCEYLLLCLYKGDTHRMFTEDPTVNDRISSHVIGRPSWINQVRTKLENNEYRTVREFVQDVKFIFSPSNDNNKDSEVVRMGTRLNSIFKSEFLKTFKIHQ